MKPELQFLYDRGYDVIFHIKNVIGSLVIRISNQKSVWSLDGRLLRSPSGSNLTIDSSLFGEEEILVAWTNSPANNGVEQTFYNQTADWEFGELTDTSKITDFYGWFESSKNFTGKGIEYFDISESTSLQATFVLCEKFNGNVRGWDTAHITRFNQLFYGWKEFNQNISGWNVCNAISAGGMLDTTPTFNQDISKWTFTKINNPENILRGSGIENQANKHPQWGVPCGWTPPASINTAAIAGPIKVCKDTISNTFSVGFDGDADDVTYLWEAGDGDQIFNPYGSETDIKFASEGTTTVTCTLESDTASDSPVVVTQEVEVVTCDGAEGYIFAVQRGDTVYSCLGIELKDKLQTDDIMLVQRNDVDYQWIIQENP